MSSLPGLGALPMLVPLVTACVCLAVRESRGALRELLRHDFGFDLPEVEQLRVPSVPQWR